MQMCVVEMTNRPGKPLFHLEHYIEGKYIKYNSNSGFVRDDNIRLTPQVSGCLLVHLNSDDIALKRNVLFFRLAGFQSLHL